MAASLRHRTWSHLQTQTQTRTHTHAGTRTRAPPPLPLLLLLVLLLHSSLVAVGAEETRECSDYEYKDRQGNCLQCTWCEAGQELSKECGFGYGEDARCVACRPQRFKEKFGLYKCKPCLDCSLLNRPQTAGCNATNNAVCGDCLPGYYRKTSLGGFLDMECIPCGDPPPPYESQCNTPVRPVNLVPIPSTVTSPRDMALAAVICSALATVLLALMVLCGIYCKRQLLEKKPNGSLRCQEVAFCEAELACLDRRRALEMAQRPCCHCHHGQHGPAHTCGPVQLIPSLCCEDTCSLGRSGHSSPFQSRDSLHDRHSGPSMGSSLGDVSGHPDPGLGEPPEVCPLPLSLSVGAPKPFFTCLCTLRPPPDALIASAEHADEERDEEQREEEEEEDEQEVEEEEEKEEEMRSSPELGVQEEEALAERAPLTQQ